MLYDTSIEETRCTKNRMTQSKQFIQRHEMCEKQITASKPFFEEPRCMKESVRDMLDRLYIVAYLFKMKFRHPVAKASC